MEKLKRLVTAGEPGTYDKGCESAKVGVCFPTSLQQGHDVQQSPPFEKRVEEVVLGWQETELDCVSFFAPIIKYITVGCFAVCYFMTFSFSFYPLLRDNNTITPSQKIVRSPVSRGKMKWFVVTHGIVDEKPSSCVDTKQSLSQVAHFKLWN